MTKFIRTFLLICGVLVSAVSFIAIAEETDPEVTILTLTWDIPDTRMNGEPMSPDEISHYHFRCDLQDSEVSVEMEIPSTTDDGIFEGQLSDIYTEYGFYNCEMAVVDTLGLYSNYVMVENGPIEYLPARPGVPTNFMILRG